MPRLAIATNLKFLVGGIKIYHDLVNRDLNEAIRAVIGPDNWEEHGFHFNRISEFLSDSSTAELINWAIDEVAGAYLPIAGNWIIDSTGLETSTRSEHRTLHYGRTETRTRADYVKLHLAIERELGFCGAAVVTPNSGDESGDISQLSPLLNRLEQSGFAIRSVTADKIYASEPNLKRIDDAGAIPYIPLKSIYDETRLPKTPLMRRLALRIHSEEFYESYRLRPFIESWISALKSKFRSCVRGHTFETQKSEALYLVLCHNLTVLTHSIIEYRLDVDHILAKAAADDVTSK